MIAFGVAIADPESYERYAAVGIGRSAEPDAAVLVRTGFDSIQEPYNSILEEAAELDGLEALVLLHEDTEILDAALAPKVREGLAVPGAELLGPIGARGVRGLAWWQAETFGRLRAPAVTYDGWFFGSHPVSTRVSRVTSTATTSISASRRGRAARGVWSLQSRRSITGASDANGPMPGAVRR
jgi:hypothetical protein